jgi:hypothetical protein
MCCSKTHGLCRHSLEILLSDDSCVVPGPTVYVGICRLGTILQHMYRYLEISTETKEIDINF